MYPNSFAGNSASTAQVHSSVAFWWTPTSAAGQEALGNCLTRYIGLQAISMRSVTTLGYGGSTTVGELDQPVPIYLALRIGKMPAVVEFLPPR